MLYIHSPSVVVRIAATLTFLLAAVALCLVDPAAAKTLWGFKGLILAAPSALLFLLTIRPVFHLLHRCLGAKQWWFPLLDGKWTGEAHSNWPRIKALMEAATGEGPPFDALRDNLTALDDPVPVMATIESGLLDYKITLRITGSRKSDTLFVRPMWTRPEPPRLAYIYEQCEDAMVEASDVRIHRGAAILTYDKETETLSGEYWTQRQASLGLNTAGSLILRREASGR